MPEPLETYLNSYLEFVRDITTPDGLQKVRESLATAVTAHDREVAARTLAPFRAAEAEWRRTPMDPRTEERDWVKADIHFRTKVLAALRSGTEGKDHD